MAAGVDDFMAWLDKKLKELNTDEGVFGSYITGILDGDETQEEKTEALEGILSEIITNDITQLRAEIMEMWCKLRLPALMSTSQQAGPIEDVDIKLARLLESQSLQAPKQKHYTEEEKKIREAILSQYSQMTDDEDEEDKGEAAGDSRVKENGLEKNRNAQSVMQAEKEKRENAKLESQKKKEKDKEDREKQKQLREEKKEKRKTQKGERRR